MLSISHKRSYFILHFMSCFVSFWQLTGKHCNANPIFYFIILWLQAIGSIRALFMRQIYPRVLWLSVPTRFSAVKHNRVSNSEPCVLVLLTFDGHGTGIILLLLNSDTSIPSQRMSEIILPCALFCYLLRLGYFKLSAIYPIEMSLPSDPRWFDEGKTSADAGSEASFQKLNFSAPSDKQLPF